MVYELMIIFTYRTFPRFVLWGLVLMLGMASCSTGPQVISPDMSSEELVQRAQEASDRNRYGTALSFYKALLERNQTNYDWILTAEYEIAFIHYKQKKYGEAREELNALLNRYENADAELLPQQFKRLSNIVLESIEKKERGRKKTSRSPEK
jgi:outer membrane protein assembly factor BamD (BamD/ComL family)